MNSGAWGRIDTLVGYRSGYHNNASFGRAFCRRFGVPPSNFRSRLAV
jgi:AraC-like DNA-binding protein